MYNTRVYIYVCVLCVLCTSSYAYYARSTYELVVDIIRGSILASTYYSGSILVQYSVNILGVLVLVLVLARMHTLVLRARSHQTDPNRSIHIRFWEGGKNVGNLVHHHQPPRVCPSTELQENTSANGPD